MGDGGEGGESFVRKGMFGFELMMWTEVIANLSKHGGSGLVPPLSPSIGSQCIAPYMCTNGAHEIDEHDLVKLYDSYYRHCSPNLK